MAPVARQCRGARDAVPRAARRRCCRRDGALSRVAQAPDGRASQPASAGSGHRQDPSDMSVNTVRVWFVPMIRPTFIG